MDHHVILFVQLALLLGMARVCGEIMRAMNQPAVLGELIAGVLLGPTLLGYITPETYQMLFMTPNGGDNGGFVVQKSLDTLATLGMVLLMLLTGLETDVKVLRNLGRAAFSCSFFGLVIPFACGLLLGFSLDDSFLQPNVERYVLALFLAVAMAVSAMPVIAKILMDLNLMKRNFALITLSAAVVDDTVGWILLAIITGLVAAGTFTFAQFAVIIASLVIFTLAARYIFHPVLTWLLTTFGTYIRRAGGEIVLVVVFALLCASATEGMGVHAVFGAFVAGLVVRQCTAIRSATIHHLEHMTLSVFSPIFFTVVGLKVNLLVLSNFGLLLLVLGLAIFGKVLGCWIGGKIGKLTSWESLAVGLGMSARGAVELVVASIGLQVGILNQELFSIIVLMAILTSFFAPVALRIIAPYLVATDEEKAREQSAPKGFLPNEPLKLLIPVGGGPNALLGAHFATHLCKNEIDRCMAVHVQTEKSNGWDLLKRLWRKKIAPFEETRVREHLNRAAGRHKRHLNFHNVPMLDNVASTLIQEARQDYQFIFLGASGQGHPIYDPFVARVVTQTPCHLVIASLPESGESISADDILPKIERILVPTNGSYAADAAFELATRYASATGAEVFSLYIMERVNRNPLLPMAAESQSNEHMVDVMRVTLREQLLTRTPAGVKVESLIRESDSALSGMLEEVQEHHYDLVVLGAENKSLMERLYLGTQIEAAIESLKCPLLIVVPKIGF